MMDKHLNKIIKGDCLEVLKKIPDNSIDMTFADPPFNLKKKYNHYEDSKEKQYYLNWCNDWLGEMVRITKLTGSIFVHNIPRWLTHYAEHLNKIAYFRHWISWDSGGAPMGKTLLPNHYGILYYTKSKSHRDFKFYDIRYPHPRCRVCNEFLKDYGGKKDQAHDFGPLLSDVWSDIHRIRHKKRRDEHPCQLPIPLLERLILMTTDEGDVALDPFVGTGTTAVAAKQLGRSYIGIEIDSDYVKIAEKNLKTAEETKINGCYVSVYLGRIRTMRNKDFKEIWKNKNGNLELLQNKMYKINLIPTKQSLRYIEFADNSKLISITKKEAIRKLIEFSKNWNLSLRISDIIKPDWEILLSSYAESIKTYHPENDHQERGTFLRNEKILMKYGLTSEDVARLDFC